MQLHARATRSAVKKVVNATLILGGRALPLEAPCLLGRRRERRAAARPRAGRRRNDRTSARTSSRPINNTFYVHKHQSEGRKQRTAAATRPWPRRRHDQLALDDERDGREAQNVGTMGASSAAAARQRRLGVDKARHDHRRQSLPDQRVDAARDVAIPLIFVVRVGRDVAHAAPSARRNRPCAGSTA